MEYLKKKIGWKPDSFSCKKVCENAESYKNP
jgi:hypothetical protein